MKAVCVTSNRTLEVRDIPAPTSPPPGHVLVEMDAATITHGDKFFLTRPLPGGTALATGRHDIYGANGAGRVVVTGAGVPADCTGRQVAIYKSLVVSPDSTGLWCERAQVPFASCLVLPDHVRARDYCGSLANVLTAHAFLEDVVGAGGGGVVVTAGNAATGRVMASLARQRGIPAIVLVRSTAARDDLARHGVEHVIVTGRDGFDGELAAAAARLRTTVVFDGVGGGLLNTILPSLPVDAAIHVYGFLDAATPITIPAMLLMGRNLSLRRFANLESPTVKDPRRLAVALAAIGGLIDDPLFKTRIGRAFRHDEIGDAMAYKAASGAMAILVS